MTERQRFIRLRSLIEKPLQQVGVLPVCRKRLPGFLGIGSQKSGTTWLHANLARHPDIFLPEDKELHYFDWNFHRPITEYAKCFEQAGDRLAGEITPGYATLDDKRVAFIKSLMPDLRVILLLRDPIERSWSQAVMNLIELGQGQEKTVGEQEFLEHLSEDRVRLRNDYVGIIDRWTKAFGKEQMYVGFFEDVKQRPQELLQELLAFLGVSGPAEKVFENASEKVRPGIRLEMPESVRSFLIDQNEGGMRELAGRYGAPVSEWLNRYDLNDR